MSCTLLNNDNNNSTQITLGKNSTLIFLTGGYTWRSDKEEEKMAVAALARAGLKPRTSSMQNQSQ